MVVVKKEASILFKTNFWSIYFAFIIAMPYAFFSQTALINLEQPASVIYYRVSAFYFSIFFLPFVFYGLLSTFKNNAHVTIQPLSLIFVLAVKDIIAYLFSNFPEPQAFWFSTYCNYIVASLFFLCVVSIYGDSINEFLQLYAIVNILTLVFSVITGIGQEVLAGRSHMSALHHGETAAVLSILSTYFGFQEKDRVKWLPIIIGIVLILATGNRKDIAFILLCVIIFILRKKTISICFKVAKSRFLLLIALIAPVILIVFYTGGKIFSLFDFSRYTSMFSVISENGLVHFISQDGSFMGRVASFQAGIEVAKDNPFLGGMFSLVDCQQKIQFYGYPTFPHSTVLYLYCIMGILAIIPISMYIKTGIKLIIMNHPLQYTFIYIFMRDTISGGANEAIKYLLLMMIILNCGKLAIRQYKNDGNESAKRVISKNSYLFNVVKF